MRKTTLAVLFSVALQGWAQQLRVYPTHWWTGMNRKQVQLMIHADQDLPEKLSITYPGVRVLKVYRPENKHYLFADLEIAGTTKPGKFTIRLADGKSLAYELRPKSRENGKTRVRGVHASDFIYLIMPDRFANGDPANDAFRNLRDTIADRSDPVARHGGDIKGVQDHLGYLKDLGVTAVWMTPVLENNMPREKEGANNPSGYHGYWITDHYRVDPRMGGNEAYRQLITAAHAKGMKIIQDAVYNHVGSYHHTVTDLPMKDWLNNWPSYQGSNHREEVFHDPYAAEIDKKIMVGGWFVPHLPDLNLANPYVANFIIQSSIWSTEEFGIDGWRVDTYKYCDEKFLNAINTALEKEFPGITVFGEAWTNTVAAAAYFSQNNIGSPFRHNLQGVTDFPLQGAIMDAINQPMGWTEGVNKLYMTLAQDFLYRQPMRNCIFLDNHDMNRFYSMAGEDLRKFKLGTGLLLTLRGIPQLYYGTEILMKNFKNPSDAQVRNDFPGGWASDSINKFSATGRTASENEAFEYIRKLAVFRRQSTAIASGKLMQFQPQDGIYVYFRYDTSQTVMCILNTKSQQVTLPTDRFRERLTGYSRGKNVVSGETVSVEKELSLPPQSLTVLALGKS